MPANADPITSMHDAELMMAGERLVLRADHSVFWPRERTLFVADTHFGKSGVFRRQGLNVPTGTTEADLARLEAALATTGAERLVVLGDFVHAPPIGAEPWLTRFAAWRRRHAELEIIVTRGNHDRMPCLPVAVNIDWHAGARPIGPFVCRHDPGRDPRGPVLAGHLHPVVWLSAGAERVRAPVFWRQEHGLVLPAFCGFAGGARITPVAGDRVFVVGQGEVIEARLS